MPAVTCEFNAGYDFCQQTDRENITYCQLVFSFELLKEYALFSIYNHYYNSHKAALHKFKCTFTGKYSLLGKKNLTH